VHSIFARRCCGEHAGLGFEIAIVTGFSRYSPPPLTAERRDLFCRSSSHHHAAPSTRCSRLQQRDITVPSYHDTLEGTTAMRLSKLLKWVRVERIEYIAHMYIITCKNLLMFLDFGSFVSNPSYWSSTLLADAGGTMTKLLDQVKQLINPLSNDREDDSKSESTLIHDFYRFGMRL